MEENIENKQTETDFSDEDFKDFDSDEISIPQVEAEPEILAAEDLDENSEIDNIDIPQDDTESLEEDISKENESESEAKTEIQNNVEVQSDKDNEMSVWEELNSGNVVKKYIVYIAREYIDCLDSLSIDERNAYINDAIQMKMDSENEAKIKENKLKLKLHIVIMVLSILLLTPYAIMLAHKSILMTLDNYKTSQDNFEKLYKDHFEKNKAFKRSLEYNKELEQRMKEQKK